MKFVFYKFPLKIKLDFYQIFQNKISLLTLTNFYAGRKIKTNLESRINLLILLKQSNFL